MRITRTKLREWNACYSDYRIAKLVPPSGLSPLELAALDIPVQAVMALMALVNNKFKIQGKAVEG